MEIRNIFETITFFNFPQGHIIQWSYSQHKDTDNVTESYKDFIKLIINHDVQLLLFLL